MEIIEVQVAINYIYIKDFLTTEIEAELDSTLNKFSPFTIAFKRNRTKDAQCSGRPKTDI